MTTDDSWGVLVQYILNITLPVFTTIKKFDTLQLPLRERGYECDSGAAEACNPGLSAVPP